MAPRSPEIWIVESCWEGFFHAPFNASLIEVVHLAWPERQTVFVAHSTHLTEVRAALPPEVEASVRWIALDEGATSRSWATYRHQVRQKLHPFRQAWRARRVLRAVGSLAERDSSWLFASGDASLLAALWLDQVGTRPRARPEVVFHGELAAIAGWRSRRPIWRALDLSSCLRRWLRVGGSITVLEEHVEDTLSERFPRIVDGGVIKVLPHPAAAPTAEIADGPVGTPIQVGFLGVATLAKGFDAFVRTADRLREDTGVRFRVAGFRGHDLPALPLDALEEDLPSSGIPRARFEEVVAELDYVCLPLSGEYYGFAASGSVLDAIQYLRPLITLDTPLMRRLVEAGGDIGHVCADEAELESTIRRLARDPDVGRHRMQVENLRRLRDRRSPAALARVASRIWDLEL